MGKNLIIFCFFSYFLGFMSPLGAHPAQAPVCILRIEDRHRFRFIHIEDAQGRQFFLKQATEMTCGLIGEVLGWELGRAVGVSAAPAWIVGKNDPVVGDLATKYLSTIHEVVDGEPPNLDNALQQRVMVPWGGAGAPVQSKEERGLVGRVIDGMALSPYLPKIAALDTFLGNSDRHDGNLLFNQETGIYYAIDFEYLMPCPFAKYALNYITFLRENGKVPTPPQRAALISYCQTLAQLIELFPPSVLWRLIKDIVAQTRLIDEETKKIRDPWIWSVLKLHKRTFVENYGYAKKLVRALRAYLEETDPTQQGILNRLSRGFKGKLMSVAVAVRNSLGPVNFL